MSTSPDDPRAEHPVRYILVGLASLLLIALVIGGLVLPPLFAFAAARRGHGPLAASIALGYLLYVALLARKLMRASPRD